jgi:hypothetical protein
LDLASLERVKLTQDRVSLTLIGNHNLSFLAENVMAWWMLIIDLA